MPDDSKKEIEAMKKIAEALEGLGEEERNRVFAWAYSKYKIGNVPSMANATPGLAPTSQDNGDFSDIAEISGEELKIICSDLKAKTNKDAALRVAYIVCYLRKKMMNEDRTSIKDILSQIKYHGAKDTNTSANITKQRDLLKEDGFIRLTKPAEQKAKQYVDEIRNAELKGEWKPVAKSVSKKKSNKTNTKKQ